MYSMKPLPSVRPDPTYVEVSISSDFVGTRFRSDEIGTNHFIMAKSNFNGRSRIGHLSINRKLDDKNKLLGLILKTD